MKKKTARKTQSPKLNFVHLAAWILGCEALGIAGSLVTVRSISTWYALLLKPSFAPPNWVFGPVWTTLYALMGFAAYRIWRLRKVNRSVRTAMTLFYLQLFFNFVWSFIFFGAHNIPAAFVDISAMWVTIVLSVITFEKLDTAAAWSFIPYLAWVSLATVLNYHLWILNA